MLKTTEKPAHKSKKFLAWLIQQVFFTAMAITSLVTQDEINMSVGAFLIAIVFMSGASTMFFLGKQAALDSTVRGFAMIGSVASMAKSKLIKAESIKPLAHNSEDPLE